MENEMASVQSLFLSLYCSDWATWLYSDKEWWKVEGTWGRMECGQGDACM